MISVIICTYNRCEVLMDCLNSLTQTGHADCAYEVIVIDNNSNDDTIYRVNRFIQENQNIDLRIVSEEKQGLAFGRNRGVKEAKGELIFFLDDDAIVSSRCLSAYQKYYNRFGYQCMGSKVLPWFRNDVSVPKWFDKSNWGALSMCDRGDKIRRVFYPEYPYGANLVIAKSLFRQFGFLNDKMGRKGNSLASNMEIEFLIRLERGGIPIYYVPDAEVYHLVQPQRLTKKFYFKRLFAQGSSDAHLFSITKSLTYAIKRIPERINELILSPFVYINRTRKNRSDYFKPVLRVFYNVGYLLKITQLIIERLSGKSIPTMYFIK